MIISVGFKGHDFISFEFLETEFPVQQHKLLEIMGCHHFLNQIRINKETQGLQIFKWKLSEGSNHVDLLINELILKTRGEWSFPVEVDEVCHCRQISTQEIDMAIIWGATQPSLVSIMTSASTACGTCRPTVQNMIEYRRGKSK